MAQFYNRISTPEGVVESSFRFCLYDTEPVCCLGPMQLSMVRFYCHILLSIHFTGRMARSKGKEEGPAGKFFAIISRICLHTKWSSKAGAM